MHQLTLNFYELHQHIFMLLSWHSSIDFPLKHIYWHSMRQETSNVYVFHPFSVCNSFFFSSACIILCFQIRFPFFRFEFLCAFFPRVYLSFLRIFVWVMGIWELLLAFLWTILFGISNAGCPFVNCATSALSFEQNLVGFIFSY